MSKKSQSERLMGAPGNSACFGNEDVEGFLVQAERMKKITEVAAESEKQFNTPVLRESCEPRAPTLAPRPISAQEEETVRLTRQQLVEVRSAREIFSTLDADGKLDGVPFMPEMAAYCGQTLRVYRRADFTCVEGHGLRQMKSTVFLEDIRCDGSAHDGCQRRCLMFWKEAWLKPAETDKEPSIPDAASDASYAAMLVDLPTRKNSKYLCQSTALAAGTMEMPRWNLMPFARQIRDGELTVGKFALIIARLSLNWFRNMAGLREVGLLAGSGSKTAREPLGLQPGEWVEVRSAEDISKTLDVAGRNRGLLFEPDMSDYTARRFQVEFPVRRIIHEETGEMVQLLNTVALRNLTCEGLCAKSCPRSNYWYWREDWLERSPPPVVGGEDGVRISAPFVERLPIAHLGEPASEEESISPD